MTSCLCAGGTPPPGVWNSRPQGLRAVLRQQGRPLLLPLLVRGVTLVLRLLFIGLFPFSFRGYYGLEHEVTGAKTTLDSTIPGMFVTLSLCFL